MFALKCSKNQMTRGVSAVTANLLASTLQLVGVSFKNGFLIEVGNPLRKHSGSRRENHFKYLNFECCTRGQTFLLSYNVTIKRIH